jgi:hypothetical protein
MPLAEASDKCFHRAWLELGESRGVGLIAHAVEKARSRAQMSGNARSAKSPELFQEASIVG